MNYPKSPLRRLAEDSLDAQAYAQLVAVGVQRSALVSVDRGLITEYLTLRDLAGPIERGLQRLIESELARAEGRLAPAKRRPRPAA